MSGPEGVTVEERVANECAAQGLPLMVTDPVVYERVRRVFEASERSRSAS